MVYGAMLAKSCVRSHGHPVPGVRSAAIISISRWISRAGVMPGSGRRGGSSPAGSSPASMASPGLDELRWHKPVRPGDELRIRVRVLAAERSRSKPDRGMVHTGIEVLNQHGEVAGSYPQKRRASDSSHPPAVLAGADKQCSP